MDRAAPSAANFGVSYIDNNNRPNLLKYLSYYVFSRLVLSRFVDRRLDIQGGPQKVSHKVLSISLSNIDRFSKFFC